VATSDSNSGTNTALDAAGGALGAAGGLLGLVGATITAIGSDEAHIAGVTVPWAVIILTATACVIATLRAFRRRRDRKAIAKKTALEARVRPIDEALTELGESGWNPLTLAHEKLVTMTARQFADADGEPGEVAREILESVEGADDPPLREPAITDLKRLKRAVEVQV
jgi:hypothetical protein